MVLNLTQIKETTEEVLILTPITLHQSRALLRLPQNIPKSLQITKDYFKIWVSKSLGGESFIRLRVILKSIIANNFFKQNVNKIVH